MKSYTYLIIDLACIAIPLIASFSKKFPFFKEWKFFLPANLVVAFVFLFWDFLFTEMGVWGFNPDYLTGIYLLNLPLEEVLFFICIPYACVFTYFVYKKYVSPESIAFLKRYPLFFLMLLSLVGVIFFHNKLYTFYTALFLLISLVGIWRVGYNLHFILITYLSILPFFYTSNGLLTGSFLDAPIVWYDNNENLGLRMFTIPLEDLFYGFLLFMLNVLLYEGIKARARPDKGKN